MQDMEISDITVARRYRTAQYMGRETKLTLHGSNVYCWVTVLSRKPQANRKIQARPHL